MICLMALCWIAEGFSKPVAQENVGFAVISSNTFQCSPSRYVNFILKDIFLVASVGHNQETTKGTLSSDLELIQIKVD